jgi:excisionase family DNA binding protein
VTLAYLGSAAVVTVSQASLALGVHPTKVRLLLRRGDLAGERLGSQWVIPRSELDRYRQRTNLTGRLFSQRIAWSVIASLEGAPTPWTLAREERARVRDYANRPGPALAVRLGGRGRVERLSVAAGGLRRLDRSRRWARGAGPLRDGRVVAYTTEGDLEAFLDLSNAVPDAEQPNLILRVVEDRWWPFPEASGGEAVWPTVLELDRTDAGEEGPTAP